ncbi:MAG: hypothetical protein JWQ09_3627, partial [Segetibacter sp.]|nr:hypothetical protein [Segetibacter sp.]
MAKNTSASAKAVKERPVSKRNENILVKGART